MRKTTFTQRTVQRRPMALCVCRSQADYIEIFTRNMNGFILICSVPNDEASGSKCTCPN